MFCILAKKKPPKTCKLANRKKSCFRNSDFTIHCLGRYHFCILVIIKTEYRHTGDSVDTFVFHISQHYHCNKSTVLSELESKLESKYYKQ